MRALPHIVIKEFRQISRNKVMLPLLFLMPIVQLIVLSYAADFEVKNVNMAIVDLDKSVTSQRLVGKFTCSGYFTQVGSFTNVEEAMLELEKENTDMILCIPKDLDADLNTLQPVKVQLLLNAVNNQKAGIASNYSLQVINAFNADRFKNMSLPQGVTPLSVDIRSEYWYNSELNYKTFMVPGILAILVTMLTAFLSSINIIREREMGTIEQLNVTPITKFEFILGKIIPFWIIGMLVMTFGLVIAYVLFGITTAGNLLTLYAFLAIYLIAILGIGILISTVTETQQQAMFITWFFLVIFLLLSGLFTPVDSIPEWAKFINHFNPIKYFVEVMRMVMLKGSTFADISYHFLVITGFAIFYNVLAMRSYSKTSG